MWGNEQLRFGDGWNPTHQHSDFGDGLGNWFSTFIIIFQEIRSA
jgi:hypothetical protein